MRDEKVIVVYRLSAKASFILLRVTPCDDYTTSYSKLTTKYSGERASRGTSLLHRAVALSELRSPSFRLDAVTLMTLPARVLSTGLFSSGQSQTNRSSQVARLCICPQCLAFLSNLNPPIRREFARNLSRERHECPPISSTERPSLVALRHATRHLARSTRLFTPSLLAQSQERRAQDSTTSHRRGRRRRFGSLFPRRVVVVAITTARRSLSLHGAVNNEVISDYDERDCTSHTRATDGRTDGAICMHRACTLATTRARLTTTPTTTRSAVNAVVRGLKLNNKASTSSATASNRNNDGRRTTTKTMATKTANGERVSEFIDAFNASYLAKHKTFEDHFWSTKMNLEGNDVDALTKSFNELESFLGDATTLERARELLKSSEATDEQKIVLEQIEKTLKCYIVESKEAVALRESAIAKENALQSARNKQELGYTDADGKFVSATPTVLRTKIRSSDDEAVRKSCWETLRSSGPFLCDNGFPTIIAERNRFARTLGYEDFYDMKVTQAEGFSKKKCFEMLDGLEEATRPIMQAARERLKKEKGEAATKGWNTAYALSGELTNLLDPYYPFENAPEVWGRSFSAMNIGYKGTTMRLDLCDRVGKYPNGFCHWPTPPFVKSDGSWVPSESNFTSLATPDEVGSGNTALTTLMHEGGHAAHFANIVQGSPVFAQERAPFSVALAETQSMFLDALCEDATWQARYAKDRNGKVIPWELIERNIREKQPYKVLALRGMIAVPYFEKALYELPEDQLTTENITRIADEIEEKIQGGFSGRPLMSVPHILADESSAYYHGYVFAEMAVHQTREYFFRTEGYIVDNPNVGPKLCEEYWRAGSGKPGFLGLVENLTGKPLSHDAWVKELGEDVEDVVKSEREAYEKAIAEGAAGGDVDLDMRMLFVHGDEVIADSAENNQGFLKACGQFKNWIHEKWPKTAVA